MTWTGRIAAVALTVAMGGTPAMATPIGGFSGISIFGDSLSDPGNAAALIAAAQAAGIPGVPDFPPEFILGKASDGPLWSERITAEFTARGLPARNFAFAAARARPDDANSLFPGFPGINLPAQVRNFHAATPEPLAPGHLALTWIGGNDLRNILGAFNPFTAPAQIVETANAIVSEVLSVTERGVTDLLFVTAPDLSRIPAFSGLPDEQRAVVQATTFAFNAALALAVEGIDRDVRASVFDINAGFLGALANADGLGVTRPDQTCLDRIGVIPPSLADLALCAEHFFFDTIHPTSTLHAAIAADIRSAVAPIPLPAAGWLLLGGLMLLGGLAQRRA
ncbi:MAG: SGNH/GDSL hydrolase family protein [Alkalilacustris sp.]